MKTSAPEDTNEAEWSFEKIRPDTIRRHAPATDTHNYDEQIPQHVSAKIPDLYSAAKQLVTDLMHPQEAEQEIPRSKKILFAVSCCFSMLLLVSIFYQIRINQNTARKQQFSQTMQRVSQNFQEAVVLTDLNPVRAREILSEARSDIGSILGVFDEKSKEVQEIAGWQEKIRQQEAAAYHLYTLVDVPVFFDITLIKAAGIGTRMAAYHEKKIILDPTNQAIYALSTDTKQASILAGPNTVKNAQTITIHGTKVYVLHEDGIITIDTTNKKAQIVIPHDDGWGTIVSLGTYGGNLYVLDAKHQKIWKYIATEEGFSDRQEYLQEGVPVSVSPDARMMIDGALWVKNNTEALKFGGGIVDTFVVSGMSERDTLQVFDALYSSDEEQFVYVLDKTTGRIVVLEKSGAYHAQYHWDGFRTVDDIIASEEEGKLFALQGSKIYAIELK